MITNQCTLFYIILPPHPRSTLFPYTTLFRSGHKTAGGYQAGHDHDEQTAGHVEYRKRYGNGKNAESLRKRSSLQLLKDRKSTRLNSSHTVISYAVFCLKKKKKKKKKKSKNSK